jgi:hypothetical protein
MTEYGGSWNPAVPGETTVTPDQSAHVAPIIEPGFGRFANLFPTHMQSVYAAPALIPTAAVYAGNPWDTQFGPIGIGAAHGNLPGPALAVPNQTGTSSFA